MSKRKTNSYKKPIILLLALIFLILITILSFLSYWKNKKVSQFENACYSLGFTKSCEQNSLIDIFTKLRYFNEENLWDTITSLSWQNQNYIFNSIQKTIRIGNAIGGDLGIKYIRKNIFSSLNQMQALELLVWLGQNGFAKKHGMENLDLSSQDQDKLKDIKNCLTNLNLLDPVIPQDKNYDYVWIVSGGRESCMHRIETLIHHIDKTNEETKIYFLVADDRELFAELDGLSKNARIKIDPDKISSYQEKGYNINNKDSKLEDGKKYIKYLARKKNIVLSLDNNIVCYPSKIDCPEQRVPNRHYANYDTTEFSSYSPICEDTMVQDITENLFKQLHNKIEFIRCSAQNKTHVSRASYVDICKKAAYTLVQNISNNNSGNAQKNIKILICSSNPHTKRHVSIAQLEINTVINNLGEDINVSIDGLGTLMNKNTVNTKIILSELGALMIERYRAYLYNSDIEDINIDNMINKVSFSSREEGTHKNNLNLQTTTRKKNMLQNKLFDFFTINPIDILIIKFLDQ